MDRLRRLRDQLGFTPGEVKAVILLSIALVVGHGIRYLNDRASESPLRDTADFDYRALDSVFVARSATPPTTTPQPSGRGAHDTSRTRPVNINTADAVELAALPGIGPVSAGRIVAYREAHGPFRTVEDLLAVRGIGQKRLSSLRALVVLR